MASIPQKQISDAYYMVGRYPNKWYGFGRGYSMYRSGPVYKLVHYGTTIYEYNEDTRKLKVDGWSLSDVMAINSLAYHTGSKGVYLSYGTIYVEGTGPRYEKKSKRR